MPPIKMGPRPVEFILSEANGDRSRESGTFASGNTGEPGQILQFDGADKLVPYTGETDSGGGLIAEAAGILMYAADATDGDVEVAYLDDDAEVKEGFIIFPDETTGGDERATAIASLLRLGIKVR